MSEIYLPSTNTYYPDINCFFISEKCQRGYIKGAFIRGLQQLKKRDIIESKQIISAKDQTLRENIEKEYKEGLTNLKNKFYTTGPPELTIQTLRDRLDIEEDRTSVLIEALERKRQHIFTLYDELDRNNRELRDCRIQLRNKPIYPYTEFDTYEGDESETCCICFDLINKNCKVYKCKSCNKSIHSHCYLWMTLESRCPNCRCEWE